jgi:4'-phosphopantetheinyl transferase
MCKPRAGILKPLNEGREADRWSEPVGRPHLEANHVHVWRAHVPSAQSVLARLNSTLSGDEQARASQFYFRTDRTRFVVGRGALRSILSIYLDTQTENIAFRYGSHGKPAVSAPADATDIYFNLSHSKDWTVLAVARARAVGIDIEHVRSNFDYEEMAALVFSERDRRIFDGIPAHAKLRSFFDAWTGKEAYVKTVGKGLSFPLSEIEGTLRAYDAPPVSLVSSVSDAGCWSLRTLDVAEGYSGSLVVAGEVSELRCLEWNPHRP